MMKQLFILLFLFLFFSSNAQQNFIYQVRLGIKLGTPRNSIGLNCLIGYQNYFTQVNITTRFTYFFSSYGNRTNFWENRTSISCLLLGGKKNQDLDLQIDELHYQSSYSNGIGYAYIWYNDPIGTSQRSGSWALHLKSTSIIFENDVFGGQAKDRFRTGNLFISFRKADWKYYSNISIWTGETKNSDWDKTPYLGSPYGYRNLEHLPFGKTSHGIASIGLMYFPINNNFINIEMGIDSEEIRHFFQNKLIHDLILLPKKMKRNTPHYPRLNADGCVVFDKKLRKPDKWVFQLSANDCSAY